jgi:hypothetical protein
MPEQGLTEAMKSEEEKEEDIWIGVQQNYALILRWRQ